MDLPDVLKHHYIDEALEAYPVYVFKPVSEPHDLMAFDLERCEFVPYKDYQKHAIAFVSRREQTFYYLRLPYQLHKEWSWCIGHQWRGSFREHPNGNPWHYMYKEESGSNARFEHRDYHPNEIADRLHRTLKLEGSYGNGRGPEFDVHDLYMKQGLVKVLDTDEVVELPDRFNCCRCVSDIDWRKIDKYHSMLYTISRKSLRDSSPFVAIMEAMGVDEVFQPRIGYSVEAIRQIEELSDEQLDKAERKVQKLI